MRIQKATFHLNIKMGYAFNAIRNLMKRGDMYPVIDCCYSEETLMYIADKFEDMPLIPNLKDYQDVSTAYTSFARQLVSQ